ncbi:hypothetical protein [Methylopila turkensis]|uniref:Uncharacterized protein n=1 Tax=Methylopila turkensis TaxID=1437816 RepID=A0A9W6N8C9_9HYPH|nr:hypothetical protein [Methylopila turkensis]GLK81433.1 hypothetical protein GCM10008174_31740 [Methylopila turkensis]
MTRAAPFARDDAKLAALEQRVYGLERGVHDLNQLFTGRIGEVSAQLTSLSAKFDDRSRTPWGTIVSGMGVVFALLVAGCELARAPIVDAIARLERDVARTEQVLARQRDAGVARELFAERGAADVRARAELQRQIDDLKRASSSSVVVSQGRALAEEGSPP